MACAAAPGSRGRAPPLDAPSQGLGSCKPACGDGFICRYPPGKPDGVCGVAPGRCRFDQDCPVLQGCRRFSERLGTCMTRGG